MKISFPFIAQGGKSAPSKGANKQTALSNQLKKTVLSRARQDIGRWRNAMVLAENEEYPNRWQLYQLYEDLLLDNHLASLISTRKQYVMASSFSVVKQGEEEVEEVMDLFQQPWFFDLLSFSMDAIFYGHSLIELGYFGLMGFEEVSLVPRQNVIPERGEIKLEYNQREGDFSYRSSAHQRSLVEVGGSRDLGLLAKAAPNVLWKKIAQSSWSEFAELFGMPLRLGHTSMSDMERVNQMEQMLQQMGSASYAIFDESEQVEFVESKKPDAWQVFDKLVERCNMELSKLILGQTMTSDSGSSQAQANVHMEVLQTYTESDKRKLAAMVNHQLIPIMAHRGANLEGYKFKWLNKGEE